MKLHAVGFTKKIGMLNLDFDWQSWRFFWICRGTQGI